MVELAQELIDAIIDELLAVEEWYRRFDSLRTCALTTRMFLGPAQRRLFQSLTLDPGTLEPAAITFTSAPHLAAYVRTLHLSISFGNTERNVALATIMAQLRCVHRLMISAGRDNGKWYLFSDDLRSASSSFLALPTLRCVGFADLNVPASWIRHALWSYKELALISVKVDHENGDFSFPSRAEGDSNVTLTRLGRHRGFLATASIFGLAIGTKRSSDGLDQIAVRYSGSIRHLEINFRNWHDKPVDIPPGIPGLRFLTLKASVRKFRIPDSLMSVVATLPTRAPQVEVVTVIVKAEFQEYRDNWHCPHVDQALKSLPQLRKLYFEIYMEEQNHDFLEDMKEKLPMANDAGLLSCSISGDRLNYSMRHFSN
ncbi:hypothetical protein B0H19DRAFT_1257843 [Mycena capillaripes]|nr:hypothetical protein B0H19DRAFT_1257843 [Mycena capillaripes]